MELELKVAEALQNDVGRGIVRLDTKTRDKLGLSTGDIVEIAGKKSTGAIVWRAYSEDEGLGVIRMDGIIRQNAEISLGDKIRIRKASAADAQKVVLSPAQPIRFSSGFGDFVKRRLLGRPIVTGDRLMVGVLGTTLHFTVVQTLPQRTITRITDYTEILVKEEPLKVEKGGIPTIAYEDIGGLREEVQKIREIIELPMKHPELFDKLGIEPPKGVLLHGPPGTGKTLIAKAVANETNAYFIPLNGPEIMSKFYGESEERLRRMFKDAEKNAPSIIFIDELDAIAPKREEVHGEVERRVVAQLLALMDGLKGRGRVIVIGATNRPDAVDPALRRPGRFDREIMIGVPDRNGRKEVLQIHTRGMPLVGDKEEQASLLDELAAITHGFVGADLESLCKEAAMGALRIILPKINLEEEIIPPDILENLTVTKDNFMEAYKMVEPSALREVFVEIPNVSWEDVGGLEDVKKELAETVEWPIKYPHTFTQMGITPPRGVLIFGPPGCGKTLLAKAVANESEANFISVKGPEMLSKWVGESEKAVRQIFKKAKQAAPTIIFFDEIDAISSIRGTEVGSRVGERVLNQLLTEMDGVEELHNVVVIAATNRPDLLDPALLRPGRFDKVLLVPSPDVEARLEIFKIHTKNMPLGDDVDLKKLAMQTADYVGADIEGLCREAAMLAIRDVLSSGEEIESKKVSDAYFKEALKKVRAGVTKDMMKSYEGFLSKFEAKELEKLVYMG